MLSIHIQFNNLKMFLFVVLFLITGGVKGFVISDSGCRTPYGVGDCVELDQCEKLLTLVSKIKSGMYKGERYRTVVNFLNEHVCDTKRNSIHVCCPRQEENRITTTETPEIDVKILLPSRCGDLGYGNKIANGTESTLMEFPWMALLGYEINGKHVFQCGGTLINDRYILTAAHCINSKLKFVRLGEHNINTIEDCETPHEGNQFCAEPIQDIPIDIPLVYPSYSSSKHIADDIALIRLIRKADISAENVRPVCLPLTDKLQSLSIDKVEVTGWGITDENRSKHSNVLMKVTVPVVPVDDCRSVYGRSVNITEKHICIGGETAKGSCHGDSGGPLQFASDVNSTVRYVQFGVISSGPSQCGRHEPGVHTRLSHYINWILKNIKP